jgi:nickel superoxide dismutase
MLHRFISVLDRKFGFEQAKAHCDIPCGIYDPHAAQVAAVTVVRMLDLMADLEGKGGEKGKDYINSMSRYVAVKEEHAEKAKAEIRIIWGDYIKAQHLEKYPELHGITHQIMQFGSKSRQTTDRQAALDFVEAINKFAEIFWATKNMATRRAKSPYNPPIELVYPVLW